MSAAGSLGTIKLSTETRITQLLRVNWYDINIKYLFKMIKLKMYLIFHAPCAEKWVLRVTQWAIVWTHNVDHV